MNQKDAELEDPAKADPTNPDPGKKSGVAAIFKELVELVFFTVILLVLIRQGVAEARYIPTPSMEPTLQINDRILVEKFSSWTGSPIKRGDILVFYPPPSEMGGKDLSYEPLHILGRLTGLPFLPNEPAWIKRVIGLPGERIRIKKGVGVFINDQLLTIEGDYTKEAPDYDLNVLGDIGKRGEDGEFVKPFGDSNEPIFVPAGHLFMMGDNRNNSEDSHVWGFLDQKRVVGRAFLLFWRHLEPPHYPASLNEID